MMCLYYPHIQAHKRKWDSNKSHRCLYIKCPTLRETTLARNFRIIYNVMKHKYLLGMSLKTICISIYLTNCYFHIYLLLLIQTIHSLCYYLSTCVRIELMQNTHKHIFCTRCWHFSFHSPIATEIYFILRSLTIIERHVSLNTFCPYHFYEMYLESRNE